MKNPLTQSLNLYWECSRIQWEHYDGKCSLLCQQGQFMAGTGFSVTYFAGCYLVTGELNQVMVHL